MGKIFDYDGVPVLHTLLPGLAILEAVANRYQCRSFAASPYGVREGYLMYMLEEESRHD